MKQVFPCRPWPFPHILYVCRWDINIYWCIRYLHTIHAPSTIPSLNFGYSTADKQWRVYNLPALIETAITCRALTIVHDPSPPTLPMPHPPPIGPRASLIRKSCVLSIIVSQISNISCPMADEFRSGWTGRFNFLRFIFVSTCLVEVTNDHPVAWPMWKMHLLKSPSERFIRSHKWVVFGWISTLTRP